MATTMNLQKSINWALPFLKQQPLDFNNMEPALTSGNMVMQTLFSAPFKWRFNRGSDTFATIANKCDYVRALPDFGYLEDQWLLEGTASYPLFGALSLPYATGAQQRPSTMAAQNDDNAGNITMRTKEMPGKTYNIGLSYQRKAPILLSVGTSFGPWPDEFAFVFNWGFITVMSLLVDDSRFAYFEKFFISRLLSLQGGLSDVDRNIFLALWGMNIRTMINTQGAAAAANSGRAG